MSSAHSRPEELNEEQEIEGDRKGDQMEESSVLCGSREPNEIEGDMRQQESSIHHQGTEYISVNSPPT